MTDPSTRLILDALSRAVAQPAGLPLYAGKASTGLFPATAQARQAARRCQDNGLLRVTTNGKPAHEVGVITDKGLDWLLEKSNPRQVLEDIVRVLEEKKDQAAELIAAARGMADSLASLRQTVERLAPLQTHHLNGNSDSRPGRVLPVIQDILDCLERWHGQASGDCPLPELYQRLAAAHSGLTLGCFHDALRELHDQHRVYLHPWTGPLYELPRPPLALLVGHEIAYYASARK